MVQSSALFEQAMRNVGLSAASIQQQEADA
jgi:hypothetical protein